MRTTARSGDRSAPDTLPSTWRPSPGWTSTNVRPSNHMGIGDKQAIGTITTPEPLAALHGMLPAGSPEQINATADRAGQVEGLDGQQLPLRIDPHHRGAPPPGGPGPRSCGQGGNQSDGCFRHRRMRGSLPRAVFADSERSGSRAPARRASEPANRTPRAAIRRGQPGGASAAWPSVHSQAWLGGKVNRLARPGQHTAVRGRATRLREEKSSRESRKHADGLHLHPRAQAAGKTSAAAPAAKHPMAGPSS